MNQRRGKRMTKSAFPNPPAGTGCGRRGAFPGVNAPSGTMGRHRFAMDAAASGRVPRSCDRWRLRVALGIGLALVPVGLAAQGAGAAPPAAADAATGLPASAGSSSEIQPDNYVPAVGDTFMVGQDDLLAISVYRMPGMSLQVRVPSGGSIRLPMLRNAIPAKDRTSLQIAQSIRDELVAEQLANDPIVHVIVRQVLSRPIVVSGAVKDPLVLQATRPMSVLEVLARAGGPQSAGSTLLITQPSATGPVTRTLALGSILDGTQPDTDLELTGGDTVRVLPARMVFAVGALQKPGGFPLLTNEPISVMKAVALAEGFSTVVPADKSHAEIIRHDADGKLIQIPINLDKTFRPGGEDPQLRAGDVLYVPENGKRKFLNAALTDFGQGLVVFVGYNLRTF